MENTKIRLMMVKDYFKKYPELFNKWEQKMILDAILYDCYNPCNHSGIREIYDEFGWIPKDKNIYDGFADLIDREIGLDGKNVVEVGGGHLPRLAKRLAQRQVSGRVEVFDPVLSIYEKSSPNLRLRRRKFDKSFDVVDADLLVGLMPCGAAFDIVDAAVNNNIDFMIALCEGGPHGDEFDYFESDEEWLDTVSYTARDGIKRNNMGEFVSQKELLKYNDEYPVIYNKRK